MLTLWDLIRPARRKNPPARNGQRPTPPTAAPAQPAPTKQRAPARNGHSAMRARYDELTRDMLARHGVRVRRWRSSMTGIAWQVYYRDGSVSRLIEAPRPRGPMSAAVFLHEIGHHAIGFATYKPRCLEEYHAWRWAIETMRDNRLNVTDAVLRRMHESLHYAVAKARRRGLRSLPPELLPYTHPPAKPRPAAAPQNT